jgi:hypothetical protein
MPLTEPRVYMTSVVVPPSCGCDCDYERKNNDKTTERATHRERHAPCFVGTDVGKRTYDATMVDVYDSACWLKPWKIAHTRQGDTPM